MNQLRILIAWKFFFAFLFIGVAGFLFSCSYSAKTTQQLFQKAKGQVYDIVIVPGVPLENGKWSKTMKARILWAKYLYDEGIVKNIMFSGSAVSSAYYEGIVMCQYAVALGVPNEKVFAETKAEHSTENIYYGYQLAKELGFKKIALASDPFQTKSLRKFTRKKVSPEIALIPMVKDILKMSDIEMPDPQIDAAKAFAKDFIPLKEKQGFIKRLKGTMGYNIKKTTK